MRRAAAYVNFPVDDFFLENTWFGWLVGWLPSPKLAWSKRCKHKFFYYIFNSFVFTYWLVLHLLQLHQHQHQHLHQWYRWIPVILVAATTIGLHFHFCFAFCSCSVLHHYHKIYISTMNLMLIAFYCLFVLNQLLHFFDFRPTEAKFFGLRLFIYCLNLLLHW